MDEPDPRIEAFFARSRKWRDELLALRKLLLDCGLAEEFKWRSPVYTEDGGNVAIVWGFKDYCGLGFFKGVLLKDPEGILVAQGENSRTARIVKFTSVAEIAEREAVLRDYIREAVEIGKAGLKVELPKDDLEYPAELVDRLNGDPDFRAAFEALTPGRQRGYVLHFSQPKQSATRVSRIDKAAPRILAGKGMHDR